MSKNYPPADIQPQLWSILKLAASLPETKTKTDTATLPLTPPVAHDWPAEAPAYLVKLGRQPKANRKFTAATRRFLNGPLVVGSRSWGESIPAWLRDAVQVARLGLTLAGEDTEASQEEVVAYLMAASLAAPLDQNWRASTSGCAARSCPVGARSPRTSCGPCWAQHPAHSRVTRPLPCARHAARFAATSQVTPPRGGNHERTAGNH